MIKIIELPADVTTDKHGWKEFMLDCGGRIVTVALRPRVWAKLEDASKQWPLWLAAISGQMGASQGSAFVLREPAVQVFERKAQPSAETPPANPSSAPAQDAVATPATAAPATPKLPAPATKPGRPAERQGSREVEVVVLRRRPAASATPVAKPDSSTPGAGG